MPSAYAHHRFGVQALPGLPEDARRIIQNNRALFDVGLQGPDPLFFYKPYARNPVTELAYTCHRQTGREFFSRVCQQVKNASEEGCAYLYGVLGHYCLDSQCHPFIHEMTDSGRISHNAMESEFDRFLLELDGIRIPLAYHRGAHLKLKKTQCQIPASFYPPMTAKQFYRSLSGMNWTLYLLTGKTAIYHNLTKKVLRSMGGQNPGLLMHRRPDASCAQYDEQLLALYQKALERFPGYLEQLRSHMTRSAPFDERFTAVFG